jgi:NADH-quinone oxidoreductase subunit L
MIAAPLAGTALAYAIYGGGRRPVGGLTQNPVARALHGFWFSGWGFDWLYRRILIDPFLWLARVNRRDIVDSFVGLMVTLSEASNTLLLRSQNGRLRWYVVSMVASAVLLIALGGLL